VKFFHKQDYNLHEERHDQKYNILAKTMRVHATSPTASTAPYNNSNMQPVIFETHSIYFTRELIVRKS
jgi:hypothetical protein